jgi:hypothetical protein
MVTLGRREGVVRSVQCLHGYQSANYYSVHAFLSHQAQPDEDFDTIVGCLKEQAQFWSLASESSPKGSAQ